VIILLIILRKVSIKTYFIKSFLNNSKIELDSCLSQIHEKVGSLIKSLKSSKYSNIKKSLINIQKCILSADQATIKDHIKGMEDAKKEFDKHQNKLEKQIVQCRQIVMENKNISDKFSLFVENIESSLNFLLIMDEDNKNVGETTNSFTEIQSHISEILELV